MPAPRRAPAIDFGDVGRGIGSLANDVLIGPIGKVAKSAGKVNKKAGDVLNAGTDFMFGVRGDRSLGKNLKGAAETLAWTAATGGVGKVVGKGVRAVRGARKATKAGKVVGSMKSGAAIKAKNVALAKSKAQATGKKMAATDAKYDKMYAYKVAKKKAPVKKAVAKKKATVLR
jgi:hypothetical protein